MAASEISSNIKIQAYDSIMCGYLCFRINDFIFRGKSLTDSADSINLFSPKNKELLGDS